MIDFIFWAFQVVGAFTALVALIVLWVAIFFVVIATIIDIKDDNEGGVL